MSGANSFKFVLLPPQSDITRDWGKRLAEEVPEARVIVAEDANIAAREIVDAEAAFGWLGNGLLSKAKKLRWLQAPQAAPAAGYYYPELIAHPVEVTNFRESSTIISAPTSWPSCWPSHEGCTSSSRNSSVASGRKARPRAATSCTSRRRRR